MEHPRLTDSQLRDLQPGDRVSRWSGPGEVQTAPVARLTDTQFVVVWPDETEARYWRENGTRTNCRGEVLRMPAEEREPEPGDLVIGGIELPCEDCGVRTWKRHPTLGYPLCTKCGGTNVPAPREAVAPSSPEVLAVRALAEGWAVVGHCEYGHEGPRVSRVLDDGREVIEEPSVLAVLCSDDTWRAIPEPGTTSSAPALLVELLTLSTPCPVFYAALGPLLASSEARKEGVEIWHRPGKTWVVALVDGLPVGCGAVFLPEGDQAELASAYVLPEYRHQGVYRRLLLARTEIANAAGKTRIVATCTPASASILARLGFAAIGESAGYTTMSLAAR